MFSFHTRIHTRWCNHIWVRRDADTLCVCVTSAGLHLRVESRNVFFLFNISPQQKQKLKKTYINTRLFFNKVWNTPKVGGGVSLCREITWNKRVANAWKEKKYREYVNPFIHIHTQMNLIRGWWVSLSIEKWRTKTFGIKRGKIDTPNSLKNTDGTLYYGTWTTKK